MTIPSVAPARALRRAFPRTSNSGPPPVSSSQPDTTTSNPTPSLRRISALCGDPEARTTRDPERAISTAPAGGWRGFGGPPRGSFSYRRGGGTKTATGPAGLEHLGKLGKPDPNLPLRRLVGVGAVDHVEGDLQREVAADRAGCSLDGIGGPNQLAGCRDSFGALEHHRDQRATGDERDQLAEKGLLGMLGVVFVGDRLVSLHRLQGCDAKPLPLEAGDYLASKGALEGI